MNIPLGQDSDLIQYRNLINENTASIRVKGAK